MEITKSISNQIKEAFYGENWTGSSYKEQLDEISWDESIVQIDAYNSIAALLYHVNFFIDAILLVLNKKELSLSDKDSYNHPPINCAEDWGKLKSKLWENVDEFVDLIAKLPNEELDKDFWDNKYGNYYRNIHGVIQHSYYHLGQIAFIKKKLKQ